MSVCTYNTNFIKRIENVVNKDKDKGLKICIIIRGLPGRGKSSLAKQIQDELLKIGILCTHDEADNGMIGSDGIYRFEVEKLSLVHTSCTDNLVEAMKSLVSVVIQSNTNTMKWEIEALASNAEELGYQVIIYEPEYAWGELPFELVDILKNSHGVPQEKLVEMNKRHQDILPGFVGYYVNSQELYSLLSMIHPITTESQVRLHITCDFFGFGMKPNPELYSFMLVNAGTVSSIKVIGIYTCDAGVGLLVELPESSLFNHFNHGPKAPHITLHVNPGYTAKQVGEALSVSTQVMFDIPFELDATFSGRYFPDNKFAFFGWKFQSDEEKAIFIRLLGDKNVSHVVTTISESILPGGWKLVDIKVSPGKGGSDDEIYSTNSFIRENLPRGLAYLISPDGYAIKVINGLSKFTGHEDDTSELGNSHKFFSHNPSDATLLLVTEKANGESCHIAFIVIDGQLYITGGSKNVHLIVRVGHPEDLEMYTNIRFSYAVQMMRAFMEKFASLDEQKQTALVENMIHDKLTAIFEYEDPEHMHIVPLLARCLKFITFTTGTTKCVDNPIETLKFATAVGLDTIWWFTHPVAELETLQQAILEENRFLTEGCVIYYMIENYVIGLVKMKNGFYIISRAIREKICSFLRATTIGIVSFDVLSNKLLIILRAPSNKRMMAFNSSFRVFIETLKKSIDQQGKKTLAMMMKRLGEIVAEQVLIDELSVGEWKMFIQAIIDNLVSKLFTFYSRIVTDIEKLRQLVENTLTKESLLQLPESITSTCDSICVQLNESLLEFDPESVRNRWPTFFGEFLTQFGVPSITLK